MRGLVLMFGWMCEVCFDLRLNMRCVVSCSVMRGLVLMFGWMCEVCFDVRLDVRGLL
jgi:hypothetical protein